MSERYKVPQGAKLPRAIVAGFSATMTASTLLFFSHLAVMFLARIYPASAFARMAQNPMVDFASSYLYSLVLVHFCFGVFLAIVYARFWEPKWARSAIWKGVTFSAVPWLASCVVLFPLSGIGFFAASLNAGPIPALGSLLFHLVYGVTLGFVYSPRIENASLKAFNPSPEQVTRDARGGALGLLTGLCLGAAFALGATAVVGLPGLAVAGMPASWFFLSSILMFSTLSMLVGVWTGARARHLNPG